MKKLLGFLGIGAGLAALVGGGIALAKNRSDDGVELTCDEDYEEVDDTDEDADE